MKKIYKLFSNNNHKLFQANYIHIFYNKNMIIYIYDNKNKEISSISQ